MEGDITLGSTGQDGFGHFDPASRRLAIYETASKQQQLLGITLGSSALVERIENFLQVTPTDVAEPIELACATTEQAQRWELALGASMESAGVQQPPRSMKKAGQRADGRKRRQRQKSVIELQYEAETREAEEGQREQQEMVEVEKELEEQAQAELDEAEQEVQDFEQFTVKRETEITQRAEEHAAEVYGMSELEADILANQSMLEDDQDVVQQVEEELAGKQAQYEKLVAVLDSLQLSHADDVGFTADDDERIIEAELNAEDQSVQEVQEELARRTAEIVAESAEVAAERLSELENRIMRQIDRVEQEQESVNAQADEIELEADDAQQSVDNPRYAQELDALRVEMESATSKQIAQINKQAESPIDDSRRSDMASGSQPLVVHNPEEEELRVQIAELEGKLQVLKVEITKQDGNMSPHTRNGSNTAFQPTAETHREHDITKLVDTTSQLKSQTATDNAEMESARRRASQLVRDIERARSRLQNLRGDEGGYSTGVGNAAAHSGQDDEEMLQNKVVAAKAALADQQQQISGLESAYRATQLAVRAEEEALLKARSRYTPKINNYLAGSLSTQRVMDSRDGMSSYDEIQLQTSLTLDQTEDSRLAVGLAQKRVKRLRAEISSQTRSLEAVKGRHGGKGNCRALQQLQLEKRSAQDELREEKFRKAAAASCLRAALLAQHETEAAATSSRRAGYRSGTRQQREEKAYDQIAPPPPINLPPPPPGRLRLGCTAPAAGQSVWVGEPHWSPHLFAAQPKHGRHIHVLFRKESIHPQESYTRK